jgi:hypothetical protein
MLPEMLRAWLLYLDDGNYAVATQRNSILALHCLSRAIGVLSKADPLLSKVNISKVAIEAMMGWTSSQGRKLSAIANKQTIARNCRDSYEQDGVWVDVPFLLESEKLIIKQIDLIKADYDRDPKNFDPLLANQLFVRNGCMYLCLTMMPTWRSQNYLFFIRTEKQHPKGPEKLMNAIIFEESEVNVELAQYKTEKYFGFKRFIVPKDLEVYLRFYRDCIRPLLVGEAHDKSSGPFFCGQRQSQVKNVGKIFGNFTEKFLKKRLLPGMLRKVMETYASECEIFNAQERREFSHSLLHDLATAQRSYVLPNSKEHATKQSELWKRLRDHYVEHPDKINTLPAVNVQESEPQGVGVKRVAEPIDDEAQPPAKKLKIDLGCYVAVSSMVHHLKIEDAMDVLVEERIDDDALALMTTVEDWSAVKLPIGQKKKIVNYLLKN